MCNSYLFKFVFEYLTFGIVLVNKVITFHQLGNFNFII